MDGLMRHVTAAANVSLPGHYLRLMLGDAAVGFVLPEVALLLWAEGCGRRDGGVAVADAAGLARCAAALAAAGWYQPRGEKFDVRAVPGGAVLAQLDRGALPRLGIAAEGVHLNGLVRTAAGWDLWVARRAAGKQLDPGKLDHLVAGGISAGMDPRGTLVKEAAEEAGMPASLAGAARFAGIVSYAMERPEGLRRDRLHCFDLELPEDFVPVARDGEVESFQRMSLADVFARVRDTDDFKFNVNLVLIDLFRRLGMIGPGSGLTAPGDDGI